MKVLFSASVKAESDAPTSVPPSALTAQQRPQTQLPFTDDVLDRHRAAVLSPQTAVLIAGQARPLPTAYRLDVLLVPDDMWASATIEVLNSVLADGGLVLDAQSGPTGSTLPRPVPIRVLPGSAPVVVDAWVVLQTLRAALAAGELPAADVDRLSLDHLLYGAAFAGPGGTEMDGVHMPTGGSGLDGINAYGRAGYGGRIPVALALTPAPRRPVAGGGRRPVVAVLDSGAGEHPWLSREVVSVRNSVQEAVIAASIASVGRTGPAITTPQDGPAVDDPLVGTLTSHFGHGTFIAGLLRQLAPDADIQVVRVMHSDGVAYESEVLCALWALAREVRALRAGDDRIAPVDIVSLSFGYFDESPDSVMPAIAMLIDELTSLGITVVASAGNSATTRQFLPAALAPRFTDGDRAPLLAVGALNPNGTRALFSDDGPWVSCFATGASVVSAFPISAQGSAAAANRVPGLHRESLDSDDFSSGFAMWSGSSFAVPVVVARLAEALSRAVVREDSSSAAAVGRARAALSVVVAESETDDDGEERIE